MKPHEIDRVKMLGKLHIVPTKTYSVTLFNCREYEGCWLEANWLFDDIDIAKSFIDKYRVDKTRDIKINVDYEIARNFGDYQKLVLKELETTDVIPVIKNDRYGGKLYSLY